MIILSTEMASVRKGVVIGVTYHLSCWVKASCCIVRRLVYCENLADFTDRFGRAAVWSWEEHQERFLLHNIWDRRSSGDDLCQPETSRWRPWRMFTAFCHWRLSYPVVVYFPLLFVHFCDCFNFWFLDPEGGPKNATVLLLVLGISSLKTPKAFLIRSRVQRNFAYTFMLTFSTDLPSQTFSVIST